MHATRFYKLLYYGCRAWQFSDNGFAGTTVGYVEWDHCWAFDNETEQGFILTQTPTELHIQLDTPRFIPGITPCTTPPEVPSFEAPYWVILSGRLKHPKLILKILVNAQQVAVETKKDGDEHKLSHRHLFLYIPNLTH